MHPDAAAYIDELLAATRGRVVGFDSETTGLDPFTHRLRCLSFAVDEPTPRSWCVPLGTDEYPYQETLERLAPLWEADHCKLLAIHNATFDATFLAVAGYRVKCPIACTLIGARLIDELRLDYTLDTLCGEWLGEKKLSSYGNVGGFFGPSLSDYAQHDAVLHLKLWRYEEPRLKEEGVWRVFTEIEMEILPHVVEMMVRGLPFDVNHLYKMRVKERALVDSLAKRVHEIAGFRFQVDSAVEVGDVIFKRLKVSDKGIPTTKTGQYSTKADYLEAIQDRHPIIPAILEYREHHKLLSAFIEPYIRRLASEPRIHPNIKQCEAVTGRMACADPNVQQIDKDPDGMRGAVVAPPGSVIIQSDLSQVELRLLAWRSQDPNMIQAFIDRKDLHKITGSNAAARVGAQYDEDWRSKAKTVNFGVAYGMAKKSLAKKLKCTEEEAQQFIDGMFAGFPGIPLYYREISGLMWSQGYVTTFTGRKRRFPNYRQDRRGWTEAINHPIQGGCADMLKLSLRNFYRIVWEHRLNDPKSPWWDVYVLMCIHDEMLVLSPESIAHEVLGTVIKVMETSVKLNVPIVSEGQICRSWGESKLKASKRIEKYLKEGMPEERIRWFFPNESKLVDSVIAKHNQRDSVQV